MGWLLGSRDPSVRYLTLTGLLGQPEDSAVVRSALRAFPDGPRVAALLVGLVPDAAFGVHPYQKWTGAHCPLVSLVDLGVGPE